MKRNDEYFTSLKDIEKELVFYRHFFKNKIVFSCCNDNKESAFFKFFKKNFKEWKLKLFYSLGLDGVLYIYDGENLEEKKLSSGDFRAEESVEILKKSDIIVTNPPFSLFIEFFDLLIKNQKQFLIIGNHISVGYKKIFPYIKDRKVWHGVSIPKTFYSPKGEKQENVNGLCRWFTNLKHKRDKPFLILNEEYTPEKYPKYDNYGAIDCSEVRLIPKDYDQVIGVPVSFIDKWNPHQFSLISVENNLELKEQRQPLRILICVKKYSSFHSVKELAERQNLSESAIRKYIRVNKIPRREERKEILHNQINSLFQENPNLSIRQIARKLSLSPTTVSKYLHKENTSSYIDFEKLNQAEIYLFEKKLTFN